MLSIIMNGRNNHPAPQQNKGVVRREETRISFSGPLPPPNVLEQYDRIVPGAADRIIKMAEQQSQHRRELERKVIDSDVQNSKLGLIFGFIIGLVLISGGIFLIWKGYNLSGVLLGVVYVGSVVGIFVYGSWERRKEREHRHKEVE
mgnify:CR=1 FL=1